MRNSTFMQKDAIARTSVFVLCLVVASVAREGGAQEDQGIALKDRVMRELPGALARLEAVYSEVSVSGTSNRESRLKSRSNGPPAQSGESGRPATAEPMADLESTSSHNVVLQASHDLRKVYQTVLFDKHYDKQTHSIRDSPTTPVKPSKSVLCVGRDYSFRLRWDKHVPILTSYGAAKDEDTNDAVSYWYHHFLELPCGVFGGHRLSKLMSLPSFSVTKVTKTPGKSGENLLVEFEFALDDLKGRVIPKGATPLKSRRMWRAWIELSPNDAWAVQASGPGAPRGQQVARHDILYGAFATEFRFRGVLPFLSRVCGGLRRWKLRISILALSPIANSLFHFTAFRNSTPRLDEREENLPAVAAFLAAFVALAASITLKHFGKAGRKA